MAVGISGQNGGRITYRTVLVSPLPNLHQSQTPVQILPAEPNRLKAVIVSNGIVFFGETIAIVNGFATLGTYALSSGVPLTVTTTEPIVAAAYDSTDITPVTLRIYCEYFTA